MREARVLQVLFVVIIIIIIVYIIITVAYRRWDMSDEEGA